MDFRKRIDPFIIPGVFVIVLFFLNFYSKTFFSHPTIIHQWRQADCLSITKNYYEEGLQFFHPKIHYQGSFEGKAVSEFPILNYITACLWKLFGEHEFIYRLLEYVIFISALFVLFNTIFHFFKSGLLAFFSISIFLTSPLLVYYSVSFIADVPALSLGIISFCLALRFYHTKRQALFYWALFFGTLAVLIKASALMSICILLFLSLVDLFNLNTMFKTDKLFVKKTIPLLSILTALAVIFGWYKYALFYNNNNSNNVFLLTVLPIWEMQEETVIYNLKALFNTHLPVFLNKPMFFLFIALAIYVGSNFKKLGSFYKYSFAFSAAFFVFYVLFFFQVFGVHDYYLINLMIFPVITFLSLAHLLSQTPFIATNKLFLYIFVICITLFNSFHAAAIYRLRAIEDDKLTYWFPFVSEDDRKLAKYLFWDYGNSIKHVEEITPALRTHNIKREDMVLSIPDQSFNISLYFMDQKGITLSRESLMNDSLSIDSCMNTKIKYIVLSDTTLKRQIAFKRTTRHFESFFTEGNVEVFRLKNNP